MRIDHVALFCKDLEKTRQFFLDHFEVENNKQYYNPRTGLQTYILTFPNGGASSESAAYPDVNWKEGKLLNHASKKELEDWVK